MKEGIKLDIHQLKAIKHGKGPLLIIAGAGTGKTTVITERIKYLVLTKKINPSHILALTFTEKAVLEMEERVDKIMPYGFTQMWISTFHSFCDRILRNECIHIGLNPSYKLLTEAEIILLLRQNIFEFKLNYFRPLSNPNKFLSALIQHFSRLKDEDITPSQYLKFVKTDKILKKNKEEYEKFLELANAFKTYEDLKTKEGVMDFSDLISNTLKLFRERKNILSFYQKQFEYILIDEFQDTNYAQNELANLLAGHKKNITVVGDDDQSIYRFRGSSISNILQFKQKFKNTKVVTLINNFRSTKEILNKSYLFIQNNNPNRLEAKEKINKKLVSVRNLKGEKVNLIYKERVEDEADSVSLKIKEIIKTKKYNYKDIAILVRANDHADNFIRAFERRKIPYQFLGPGRLFYQEEIKDLIAYLKVLYNFEDSSSLYRVLNMEIFNLTGVEISALLNLCKKKNYSLFESLQRFNELNLDSKTQNTLNNIHKMIKKHLDFVKKESAGQILYYFLEDSGLIKKIIDYKSFSDEKIAKNIAKFFDKLKSHEINNQTSSIYDVVDWIDLSMQTGESPLATDLDWNENNAVNILTIHSSKGLEFPIVFLVNLVTQRFPTRERSEKIQIPQKLIKEITPTGDFHLQEERRLFYVGMTRARDLLFLTAASFYGEGIRERKISPFVYETLGKNDVEEIVQSKKTNKEQLFIHDWNIEKDNNNTKQILRDDSINYLSYSQIQTFDLCPLHYKLKYILNIPTSQSASQSFGTSIHAILRDYYQNWKIGNKLQINNIDELFKNNWINEGYLSKAHEKKSLEKAKKIINNYLKGNFNKNDLPLALEQSFTLNLKGLKIRGRIDRIDLLKNGAIEIIDYKTGNKTPSNKELAENKQLTLYALAAKEFKNELLNKSSNEIILSLVYLEENKKFTTTRTNEQLENTEKMLLEKATEISNSKFLCSKNLYCKNCEYKMLCHV